MYRIEFQTRPQRWVVIQESTGKVVFGAWLWAVCRDYVEDVTC